MRARGLERNGWDDPGSPASAPRARCRADPRPPRPGAADSRPGSPSHIHVAETAPASLSRSQSPGRHASRMWRGSRPGKTRDDVEARALGRQPGRAREIELGGAGDARLLARRRAHPTAALSPARALTSTKQTTPRRRARDQVDLAGTGAHAAAEDAIALQPQQQRGQRLAAAAALLGLLARRRLSHRSSSRARARRRRGAAPRASATTRSTAARTGMKGSAWSSARRRGAISARHLMRRRDDERHLALAARRSSA